MIKSTSPASENKARTRLVSWLAALAELAGTRLFARDDLTARQYGWQVTKRHGGLGRQYRDLRFGALSACPRCGGRGTIGSKACPACRRSGWLAAGPASPAGQRIGRDPLARPWAFPGGRAGDRP